MLGINRRSIKSEIKASFGCYVESLRTFILCTVRVAGFCVSEGHSGVKNATEVSKGMERLSIEERVGSLGLLPLGMRDTTKVQSCEEAVSCCHSETHP